MKLFITKIPGNSVIIFRFACCIQILYYKRVYEHGGQGQMLEIKRQYIMSEDNKPVSVVIDISTFEKIESVIEDYGLAKYISESDDEEPLNRSDALKYYKGLKESA